MTDHPAPSPDSLRFFGTTWVEHGPAYLLRRVAFGLGSLLATVVGAVAVWLAVSALGRSGGLLGVLLLLAVVGCSVMAALRTWRTLTAGPEGRTGWMADDRALAPIMAVGFVGTLAAYFLRGLAEAPGESVARNRRRAALAAAERRRQGRGGRPRPSGRRGRR